MFLAGVDEAGYGPLLGPLCVGYSLFRVPRPEIDLWEITEKSAVRKAPRQDRRLRVDDSKRVNSGRLGRPRMERSVAAFRAVLSKSQALQEWIAEPPAGDALWFRRAPWYRRLAGPLCPGADSGRAELDAAFLRRDLDRGGCSFDGFGARAVPAVEWNELLRRRGSKGEALFAVNMEVVAHILRVTGRAPLRIELDQHGARNRYGSHLERWLRPDRVEVHGEAPGLSLYTLHFPGRRVEVRFSQGADLSFYSVALASLAAKLTRERLMDHWNAWFAQRLPEIRGTKGYAKDARRWLDEAATSLPALGVAEEELRRQR